MSRQYQKLITLLKELFQLDQPELDFGIYRVLHAKSDEVSLHWANKDQYYVKTSEYLRDYAFRLKPNARFSAVRTLLTRHRYQREPQGGF